MGRKKGIKQLSGLVVVLVGATAVVLLLIAAVLFTSDNSRPISTANASYTDRTTGLAIDYNSNLELKADSSAVGGVMFNMAKADPRIQITAWIEEDSSIENLIATGEPLNEAMVDSVRKQIVTLKSVYPEADITDAKLTTVNGFSGGEITFNYLSDGLATTQRRLILVKDDKTIVTIACQSLQEDFEEVNQQYFEDVLTSAAFN